MSISLMTTIVVVSNGIVAIVAALLLMLVLWQAPHQRANQLFALSMTLLVAYAIANSLLRFIDTLNFDPVRTTYGAIWLYGMFSTAMFFFAAEYAQVHTPEARALRIAGIVLTAAQTYLLWNDQMIINIRPTAAGDGSYQGDWTTWGSIAAANSVLFQLIAAMMFRFSKQVRIRVFWRAPALVVMALVAGTVLWPRIPIPFNSIFLTLAALALGVPVLRHELFNPLAEFNTELARQNTELEEASSMKNRFLSNMSYELRTPLSSIIGYTELVLDNHYGVLNDIQRDRLEKVVRNGHHLLGLINDVLDLNRIAAGELQLEPYPLVTTELLDSVLATVEPLAAKKKLNISRDYDDAPIVLADAMRLRQILTNITSNAIKFTHTGGITLRAYGTGAMVRFEISDTGIGIPADKFDMVFKEFEQIDKSPTRLYEGTGLGLAITKKLVELHRGRIWFESTTGHGTTFYVTLPLARATTKPLPASPPDAHQP